jgi:uncharacterized protein (DUF1800 family)
MPNAFRRCLSLALCAALAGPSVTNGASSALPEQDQARIVHALNRLGYGPRPGDVEKVRAMGLEKWIELQLQPERIPDSALAPRLATAPTVSLSTEVLLEKYEVPPQARREMQKKRAELPEDATEEQRQAMRRELMQKYRQGMDGTPRQVLQDLQSAKLLRAVYSERQLEEVLVDFWLNHFNVFAGKGPIRFLASEYEREVIRPHAWGKFEDLLKATAESPAMLFYLDNWLSVDPKAAPVAGQRTRRFGRLGFGAMPQRPPGQGRRRGLNENYAREIMELHTLGVDGGYTQKDVTEVARCFTGWTIEGLRQDQPEFSFAARLHDKGDKVVLGQTIKSGGKEEGDKVIHLLATHPATARFLSFKLARHFVADEPPPALVDRAAATFKKTQGDIREVVRTIVTSPEFFAADARSAKVKTPFEFVASAVRATGGSVSDAREMARRIADMGMPLYMQQPPTGYKDTAETWVSTSGLLARLNFALDLAAGRVRGVSVDAGAISTSTAARLVPSGLSESTRRTLASEASPADPLRVAGLILGSPEFQRR